MIGCTQKPVIKDGHEKAPRLVVRGFFMTIGRRYLINVTSPFMTLLVGWPGLAQITV